MKVVLRETERGNTITRKFAKIRTAAGHSGKPFARASKTQIHFLMNSITLISVGEKAAHGLSNLSIPVNLCLSQTCDELFEFKAVTSEDTRKVFMATPSNKALGYDRIPLFVINECPTYCQP